MDESKAKKYGLALVKGEKIPDQINLPAKDGNPAQYMVKPEVGCLIFSRSRASLMKDAEQAGAIVRIGRSVLIIVEKMIAYYNALAGD